MVKKYSKEEGLAHVALLKDISLRCASLLADLGAAGLFDSLARMESVISTVQSEIAIQLTEKYAGKKNPEGWVWVNTSDYHYFRNGRSLCGKWVIPTAPKFAMREIDRAYNCLKCVDALKKSGGRTR